jgi:hypothetical protein
MVGERDMLPLPVGLTRAVYGPLVFLEVDEGDGQLGKVGDVVVQQLCRLVHTCQINKEIRDCILKLVTRCPRVWHTRIRSFSEKKG